MHVSTDGNLTAKLADFGLAMEVTEPIFTVCGTPTYVAPEILTETGKFNFYINKLLDTAFIYTNFRVLLKCAAAMSTLFRPVSLNNNVIVQRFKGGNHSFLFFCRVRTRS